jgi:hypothetical protein
MEVGGQGHTPANLPPGKNSGTHCIGGWLGPKAGLNGCGKSRLHRDSIPGAVQPVASQKKNLFFPTHTKITELSYCL